jgi:hypothetical protein
MYVSFEAHVDRVCLLNNASSVIQHFIHYISAVECTIDVASKGVTA